MLNKMEKDLKDYPMLEDAINDTAKILIEATEKAGYINFDIDCIVSIDDGRIYKLKFERVDAD